MYNIIDTFDCIHTNIINDIYYDKGLKKEFQNGYHKIRTCDDIALKMCYELYELLKDYKDANNSQIKIPLKINEKYGRPRV